LKTSLHNLGGAATPEFTNRPASAAGVAMRRSPSHDIAFLTAVLERITRRRNSSSG